MEEGTERFRVVSGLDLVYVGKIRHVEELGAEETVSELGLASE